VRILKALYGKIQSALLFYKKFQKDLETIGLKDCDYDLCVRCQSKEGERQTITWHDDDVKSSHKDSKVNDEFYG
jgi:hypothetical protein